MTASLSPAVVPRSVQSKAGAFVVRTVESACDRANQEEGMERQSRTGPKEMGLAGRVPYNDHLNAHTELGTSERKRLALKTVHELPSFPELDARGSRSPVAG